MGWWRGKLRKDLRTDLLAAAPSFEAMNMLSSLLASNIHGEKLMVNDVSRAFSCAPAGGRVFAELAAEDRTTGEDLVGKLIFSMHGTRDAAQN